MVSGAVLKKMMNHAAGRRDARHYVGKSEVQLRAGRWSLLVLSPTGMVVFAAWNICIAAAAAEAPGLGSQERAGIAHRHLC
jgi:hypothetical protein